MAMTEAALKKYRSLVEALFGVIATVVGLQVESTLISFFLMLGGWIFVALAILEFQLFANKSQRIQRTGNLILIVLMFFVLFSLRWEVQAPSPIAVSPNEVKLSNLFDPLPDKHQRGRIDVTVYNRGDDPYYQIWVKIIIDSPLAIEAIDLDFPSFEERVKAGEDRNAFAMDVYCVRGLDHGPQERARHKAFLCFIKRLDPKKTFQIKLTSDSNPTGLSENQFGRALMQVTHFEKEPAGATENRPGNEKGSSVFGTFHEPFGSNAIIVFCPKVEKPLQYGRVPIICTPSSQQ